MSLKMQEWRQHLKLKQGGNCYWCGKGMPRVTIDHVIPKSKGGRGRDNQVAACPKCNVAKGDIMPERFIKSKLLQIEAFLKSEGFKRYGRK